MNDDMEDIMSFSGEMIKMLPIANFNCLTVEPIPTPVEYLASMPHSVRDGHRPVMTRDDFAMAVWWQESYHIKRLRGEG